MADELVQEFATPGVGMSSIEQQFDQKNIRRRVYDALNVLMAMNIISKEKKEIKWLGLPTNSMQECTTLEKDRQKRIERLKQKTQQLHDLIIQVLYFSFFFKLRFYRTCCSKFLTNSHQINCFY